MSTDTLTAESPMRDASVGRRLRELREAEGLSLREVAEKVGVDHSTIAKIETAQDYATDRMVRLLCSVYDAEADVLLLERNIDRVPLMVRNAIAAAARKPLEERVRELEAALREVESTGIGPIGVWHTPYCGRCLGCRIRAALREPAR